MSFNATGSNRGELADLSRNAAQDSTLIELYKGAQTTLQTPQRKNKTPSWYRKYWFEYDNAVCNKLQDSHRAQAVRLCGQTLRRFGCLVARVKEQTVRLMRILDRDFAQCYVEDPNIQLEFLTDPEGKCYVETYSARKSRGSDDLVRFYLQQRESWINLGMALLGGNVFLWNWTLHGAPYDFRNRGSVGELTLSSMNTRRVRRVRKRSRIRELYGTPGVGVTAEHDPKSQELAELDDTEVGKHRF